MCLHIVKDVMEDVSEDGGRCSYTNVSYIEVGSNKVKQDF